MRNIPQLGAIDPETAISLADSIFRTVTNIFGEKVTPEQQRAKAGVWGAMLQEFLLNPHMTGSELATKWKNQLPFSQSSTKDRFVQNNLIGQSRDYIIDHLAQKINDEYTKGGIPTIDKSFLLANTSKSSILPTNSDISPVVPQQMNYPSNQYVPASVPQTVNAGMSNSILLVGVALVVGLMLVVPRNDYKKLGDIPIKLKFPNKRKS